MKMDTKTIVTVAAAIGGGLLATKFGGKKHNPLVTGAGVGIGVLAGQMIGEKVATGNSTDTINNQVSKALTQG